MRAATRLFGGGSVMLVWWAAVAGAQAAQSRATTEVGTGVGVTILSRSGFNSITHIGAPGGAGPVAPFSPLLYASFFATPSVMVEPQLSFSSTSSSGTTDTFIFIAGQVAYLFSPHQTGSAYLGANVAFQSLSETGTTSVSGPGFGGELGYRFKVRNSLAIRLNGRYRRWFSDFKDLNEIGFGLGLGATF
jgi:hypothetical protein